MLHTIQKKILIVDDDASILEALEIALDTEGYKVDITTQGEEILTKVKTHHPDLILLDVLLSGTDGRQLVRKLKSMDETKKIPVIMISAHPNARDTALRAGASDFLPKPFDIDELFSVVKRHVH